jgi:L-lactate dehydrogenase complex protein LldE
MADAITQPRASEVDACSGVKPRVALFITCLADLMRPSVGFAAATLLQDAGCEVIVPELQTCCGQPAYNSGDRVLAKELALITLRAFAGVDYVVAPSASCAGMLKVHYPKLFAEDAALRTEAEAFATRVHELTDFLVNVRGRTTVPGRYQGPVTYHDSCASLREMKLTGEARGLLQSMPGVTLVEMRDRDACCGFGGLFSVKYGEISDAMVSKKAAAVCGTDAVLLTGPDLGCLMNIAGKLSRQGSHITCRHVAELLAGDFSDPPIGVAE